MNWAPEIAFGSCSARRRCLLVAGFGAVGNVRCVFKWGLTVDVDALGVEGAAVVVLASAGCCGGCVVFPAVAVEELVCGSVLDNLIFFQAL